jgi:hypothetical protein
VQLASVAPRIHAASGVVVGVAVGVKEAEDE